MESFNDPWREWLDFYDRSNRPMQVHIDLTYECHLNCVHCFAKGSESHYPAMMDTKMVMDILDQAAELGVLEAVFSGGEPLLRKDIWNLISYARKLHFVVRLKTSGTYIIKKDVDFMAELGLIRVDISLHGIRPETHDAVTRVPGSFEKAMAAIKALHKAGIRVQVNTSSLQQNFHEVPEIKTFFGNMGIDHAVTMWIMPSETRGLEPQTHSMGQDEFIETSLDLLKKDGGKSPETGGYDLSEPLCYAGRASFHIGPDGLVHPCVTWPVNAGDLKKQGLKEIWFDSPVFNRIRSQFMRDREQCVTCNLFGYCNFCPGRAFQATENPVMPYSDACSTAQWTREAYERFFGLAPDASGQGSKDR